MDFEAKLGNIQLYLNIFTKEENYFFSSICYAEKEKAEDYYSEHNTPALFGYDDDLDKITKQFYLNDTSYTLPIGSTLIEFLNYDFDNFKDYFIYFTKYFGYYYDRLSTDEFSELERPPAYSPEKVISLVEKKYCTDKSRVKKMQETLKSAVDYIYNVSDREDLKNINFQQKFFLQQRFNKDFFDFSIDVESNSNFLLSYPHEFYDAKPKTEKQYIKRILEYDPYGRKMINNHNYRAPSIFSALYITLYNLASIPNIYIKKCKNCNKYFLSNKNNAVYCNNIYEDNKTCKQVGSNNTQKRKLEDEPVFAKYRHIQQTKCTYANRHSDIPSYRKDYENFNKIGNQFKSDIKKGKATMEELDKWLDTQDKTKKQD